MTDQVLAPAQTGSLENAIEYLKQKYPDAVKDDTRQGFVGVVVDRAQLVDIATTIRDELGFDYLTSATGVDYLGVSDHMEMVYHACRTSGGSPLHLAQSTLAASARRAIIGWLCSIPASCFYPQQPWDYCCPMREKARSRSDANGVAPSMITTPVQTPCDTVGARRSASASMRA